MNNDVPSLDLIFLAVIAAYFIYKLYCVLGQRNDDAADSQTDAKNSGNVIPLRGHKNSVQQRGIIIEHEDMDLKGLAQIRKVDPKFDPANFIKGAKIAFEMILEAFCEGDNEALKTLLGPIAYRRFLRIITQREKAGETWDHSLLRIKSADIDQMKVDGVEVFITLKFVSEQIRVVCDKNGHIIEGDPNQIDTIIDLWTFSRDATSQDQNWQLFQTETSS